MASGKSSRDRARGAVDRDGSERLLWVLAAVLLFVPIVFWRGAMDPFSLPKATVVLLGAVVSAGSLIRWWLRRGAVTVPSRLFASAVLAFLAAGLLAWLRSPLSWASFMGQYGRSSQSCSLILAVGCGGETTATYELPSEAASQYATAYLAAVQANPADDDLEPGAGEHVVVANNWGHRTDMGGWWIEDADGNRLNFGIGRQIDPEAELRIYSSCGENTDEAVFACLDGEVLDDDGDILVLRDSAGSEVARFAYGTAAE